MTWAAIIRLLLPLALELIAEGLSRWQVSRRWQKIEKNAGFRCETPDIRNWRKDHE